MYTEIIRQKHEMHVPAQLCSDVGHEHVHQVSSVKQVVSSEPVQQAVLCTIMAHFYFMSQFNKLYCALSWLISTFFAFLLYYWNEDKTDDKGTDVKYLRITPE